MLCCLFFLITVSAQKNELSLQAYSGLYTYGGSSATGVSSIYQGNFQGQDYTYNPYGNKTCFSYGASLQLQHVTKSGFIEGIQAGYEVLRSQVNLNEYEPLVYYLYTGINGPQAYQIPVSGASNLRDQNINFSPYIGYRFKLKNTIIDIMPGVDIGINIRSYDIGKAVDNSGKAYTSNFKMQDAPTDIRLKLGLATAIYKKIGINLAYAYGLTNLDKNNTGYLKYNVHSELLRFGVSYRLF